MTSTTASNNSAQDTRASTPILPIPTPTPIFATQFYNRLEDEEGITYIHSDESFTPDRFQVDKSFVPDRFIPSPGPPTSPRWIPDSPPPPPLPPPPPPPPPSPDPPFSPVVPPLSPTPSHC